jgi:malonyl-CoA/methylmalonyl-CoA synthetase
MQEFWTSIRGGRIILTRYGATEFGAIFKVEAGDKSTPEGSVGKVVSGIDVKLSNGDEGEILVKSPSMFSKSVALAVPINRLIADCEKGTFLTIKRPLLHTIKMATSALATLDIEWVHTTSLMAEHH